ncbi:hypothetical protein D3C84_902550 [compost metagenome]
MHEFDDETINWDNPALEEGISFLINVDKNIDQEKVYAIAKEFNFYYEVTVVKTQTAYSFRCLNAIERDPLPNFSSLLETLERRMNEVRAVLEQFELKGAKISIMFSHNHFGDFVLTPIYGIKLAHLRKNGRAVLKR